jgi:hypothetical protein
MVVSAGLSGGRIVQIKKEDVLKRLNFESFYKDHIKDLKRNGNGQALGRCPFHDDTHASLSVELSAPGRFNCFACGKSGDTFSFWQEIKCGSFSEAVEGLARYAGIPLEHEKIAPKVKPRVVARFDYHDENGNLLYWKERVEPGRNGQKKEFFFYHLDENGKKFNGRGCDPVIYNLPVVLKVKSLIFCEGEKQCDLLAKWGIVATTLDSGAQSKIPGKLTEWLSEKRIADLPDNDAPGREYAVNVAGELAGKVESLKIVELPGLSEKGDICDWARIAGNDKAKLIEVIKTTPEWKPVETAPDEGQREEPKPEGKTIDMILAESGIAALKNESNPDEIGNALRRLAEFLKGIDLIQRELIRNEVMVHLKGIGVKSPGALVSSVFDAAKPTKPNGQGQGLIFRDIEPWDDPVNGIDLLSSIEGIFKRFVVLSHAYLSVLALWVIHTFCLEASDITPYLNLTSPEKRCGKSLLLDLLARLVYRGQSCSNVTSAALFRVIDQFQPTLLIDECDQFLKDNPELIGILNDGFKLGGKVLRCEGEQNQVVAFVCFCPKVIAGIGSVPPTIADRCITIRMRRKAHGERVERFDRRAIEAEMLNMQRMCFRWAADNLDKLKHQDVQVLHFLNDRAFDCWRPLLAIGSVARGGWYDRAVEAAKTISLESEGDDSSTRVNLLIDIKSVFESSEAEKLTSKFICETLSKIEDRPWPEFHHDKPITPRQLASLLKPFGIRPQDIRTGAEVQKGYKLEQFQESFRLYLPVPPQKTPIHATNEAESDFQAKVDPQHIRNVADKCATNLMDGKSVADCSATESDVLREENALQPLLDLGCSVVAGKTPEKGVAGGVCYEEGVI